ncbi:cobalamin biosynthesis protein [Tianweitania sp. BSSL-BM11]|uniref:Cobalamin biosynthesis protein CobD n=1 Tax=Tianweitania aestuarii TaxID=2814886 RepID=A0ABS5RWF0_9HYPH|nr:adenosylcobinamide-phosphate synthase CbiB [Tianweitania aestuarii]MBS9720601.1 cobalamin biosynthesis protein [Tianweitania aestuarii]
MFVLLAFLSLILELALGYPNRLFAAIGHPVTWIGALISRLERMLNRTDFSNATRKTNGVLTLVLLLIIAGGIGFAIQTVLGHGWALLLTALIASSLLAQRSLATHVQAVAQALEAEGLTGGRRAVSMIVGRDPEQLDEPAVCRAAIESLAENFSDGIVAPAFWLAVGGLAGGAAYKAVNTADSMIGHKNARYQHFGWASARFDDLINLPASRLTALLVIAAAAILPGCSAWGAWRAVRRDSAKHRSPNAGWPETAFAGALGLALNGPRSYGGVQVNDAFMGEGGRRDATAADIRRALRLYWTADLLMVALAGVVALALFTWHG